MFVVNMWQRKWTSSSNHDRVFVGGWYQSLQCRHHYKQFQRYPSHQAPPKKVGISPLVALFQQQQQQQQVQAQWARNPKQKHVGRLEEKTKT